MKTKWILTLGLLLTQITFAKPIRSVDDFKTLVKKMTTVSFRKSGSQAEQPTPTPILRYGKVKMTVSKGIFEKNSVTGEWDYAWSRVCVKDAQFPVLQQTDDGSYYQSHFESCPTVYNGQNIDLSFGVMAAEGDVALFPDDPTQEKRHIVMYAFPVFSFNVEHFPELEVPVVALEERSNKSVILANQPTLAIICMSGGGSTVVPKDPVKPTPKSVHGNDPMPPNGPGNGEENCQANCQANWNEAFRVTAEILD